MRRLSKKELESAIIVLEYCIERLKNKWTESPEGSVWSCGYHALEKIRNDFRYTKMENSELLEKCREELKKY